MAKDKIFEPKDFDKDIPKNNRKKWIFWGVSAALLCIVIVVGFILWRICTPSTNQDHDNSALVSTIPVTDTVTSIDSSYKDKESLVHFDEENKEPLSEEGNGHLTSNKTAEPNTAEPKLDSSNTESKVESANLDIEQEALKVIRGSYGNIPKRKNILGDKYQIIQNRVNQLKREGSF